MSSVWNRINDVQQLSGIIEKSHQKLQLIFKHSTSCSLSSIAKARLDSCLLDFTNQIDFHYLDLLRYRNISDVIEEELDVHHESPQIIIVNNGHASHDESHLDITKESIAEHLQYLNSTVNAQTH